MTDTPSQWRLGDSSKWYESGNRGVGTVSSGQGDHGGVSYGEFQLSTKSGTVYEYLQNSRYGPYFQGLQPGTAAFTEKWKEVAARDSSSFAEDQYNFIKKTHYDVANKNLQNAGLDMSGRGPAVQDLLWSTTTQFGPGKNKGAPNIFKKGLEEAYGPNYDLKKLSDKDIIEAVQDYKIHHNQSLFSHSNDSTRAGTLKRAHDEKADLLQFAKTGVPVQHKKHEHGDHAHTHTPLHPGAHGAAVAALQKQLRAINCTDAHGRRLIADGKFGPGTRHALEEFQRANGLKVTGQADQVTKDTLAAAAKNHQKILTMDKPESPYHSDFVTARGVVDRIDESFKKNWSNEDKDKIAAKLVMESRSNGDNILRATNAHGGLLQMPPSPSNPHEHDILIMSRDNTGNHIPVQIDVTDPKTMPDINSCTQQLNQATANSPHYSNRDDPLTVQGQEDAYWR